MTSPGTIKTDLRGLQAKLGRYRTNSPEGRLAGARELARVMVDNLLVLTPIDTGMLRNGWRLAAQAADLGTYPREPQKESRFVRQWVRNLSKQYRRWDAKLRSAIERGDGPKEIKRLQRLRDKAFFQLGRFFEERENLNQDARVVWSGGRNLNFTVRTKSYGGTAVIHNDGNTATVLLKNREPHASMVERQKRPVAKASAIARQVAKAKVRRLVLRKIKKGEPGAGRAAA